jgi:TetR/AcrR family transcriptional regulator, transcriptional repressor for nem operon
MRVTREQAASNRLRIVESASLLFRKHGFDGVGVDDIARAAGLTHGGFYGHFTSKDDLAAEACAHEGVDPWASWMDAPPSRRLETIVRNYLTPRHRDDRAAGCLFAALGSDVVRQPKAVRHAFTERFRSKVETLRSLVPGRSPAARRERALATMAGLVGALTLSRAVDDPKLAEDILDAAANTFGRTR